MYEAGLTYVEHVTNESVSDDGDGALPQGGAVQVVLRVERAAQHREADESVEIEHDESEHGHPQQRLACRRSVNQSINQSVICSIKQNDVPIKVCSNKIYSEQDVPGTPGHSGYGSFGTRSTSTGTYLLHEKIK